MVIQSLLFAILLIHILSRLLLHNEAKLTSECCNCNQSQSQTTAVNAYPNGISAYGLYDTLGNLWEWTSSIFEGYEGFQPYPYHGYSQVDFDGQHRILKGGSWATRS